MYPMPPVWTPRHRRKRRPQIEPAGIRRIIYSGDDCRPKACDVGRRAARTAGRPATSCPAVRAPASTPRTTRRRARAWRPRSRRAGSGSRTARRGRRRPITASAGRNDAVESWSASTAIVADASGVYMGEIPWRPAPHPRRRSGWPPPSVPEARQRDRRPAQRLGRSRAREWVATKRVNPNRNAKATTIPERLQPCSDPDGQLAVEVRQDEVGTRLAVDIAVRARPLGQDRAGHPDGEGREDPGVRPHRVTRPHPVEVRGQDGGGRAGHGSSGGVRLPQHSPDPSGFPSAPS